MLLERAALWPQETKVRVLALPRVTLQKSRNLSEPLLPVPQNGPNNALCDFCDSEKTQSLTSVALAVSGVAQGC